ncbi:MAG: HEPN domain-containing protein [Candidatus Jordarchaeales archaeon]|nr:HEPN domain-containing protein [Candidatus Jordarchaeia archaeon]
MTYLEWAERARFFLKEGERYLKEGVYWAACFNAHQSVEFYLKGILIKLVNSYPFTHDLSVLVDELEKVGISIPEHVRLSSDYLTPHYTGARYPGTKSIIYDRRRAERCLAHAKVIAEFVEALL